MVQNIISLSAVIVYGFIAWYEMFFGKLLRIGATDSPKHTVSNPSVLVWATSRTIFTREFCPPGYYSLEDFVPLY